MKVLMLCEYFPPFDSGGSEWSTFYLANGLKEKGIKSIILTPNYGNAQKYDQVDGIETIRFPFYKKLNNEKQLTPYWHTNTLWLIASSIFTTYYVLKTKTDIIHVQGKYFLPAAILTKFLTGKKVVFTARDYIILCPLGMCLLHGNQPCNFTTFIKSDLGQYMKHYMPNSPKFRIVLQAIFSIRAKLKSQLLKFSLNFVNKRITLSKTAKELYEKSGVRDMHIIANSYDFKGNSMRFRTVPKTPIIIYAGRLTHGKGIKILFEAMPRVLKNYPSAILKVVGEGFLKNDLVKFAEVHKFENNTRILGHINHNQLLLEVSKSTCLVMPSIWPEPFGRVVLESLAQAIPAVVSRRAGISDQLSNRWVTVVEPNALVLAEGIISVIKNNSNLRKNIVKDKNKLQKTWSSDVINSYAKIYNNLIK